MVIVVCFVGGMLYYSMNVLWPRQSQAFFIPEDAIVMRGVYAMIFSCGTWRKLFQPHILREQTLADALKWLASLSFSSALAFTTRSGS